MHLQLHRWRPRNRRLNEVRPRRPEQFGQVAGGACGFYCVSMKSGLEGRNNVATWLLAGVFNPASQ